MADESIGKFLVFQCPLHGPEIGTYCFRAFDRANKDRWAWHICREQIPVSDDEYTQIVDANDQHNRHGAKRSVRR